MQVLSLFNGMSCGRMALEELNVPVTKYYSSEIDKYANKAAQALYPDTIQLGDVTQWREWGIDWASIDLVTGGFPCQAWSMAGKQLGDKDERGMLFWTMLDIMKHVRYHNPKADFLIENVKMKKEFEQYITTHTENALGHVHKILINSALVSAQNRNRYYWTSFKVEQPGDKGQQLINILEPDIHHSFYHSEKAMMYMNRCVSGGRNHWDFGRHSSIDDDKAACITANHHKGVPYSVLAVTDKALARIGRKTYSSPRYNPIKTGTINTKNNSGQMSIDSGTTIVSSGCELKGFARRLSPRECMRLQTIPERHIDTLLNAGISNTQLYKMTGNGWTVDKIVHILKERSNED